MNCVEARRMVVPYVKGELSDEELELFLKHVDQCKECMEELDIYFTFYQAMDLEDGGEQRGFDFKQRLEESISASRRHLRMERFWGILRLVFFALADLILVLSLCFGIQEHYGSSENSMLHQIWKQINARTIDRPSHRLDELPEPMNPIREPGDFFGIMESESETELYTETEEESEFLSGDIVWNINRIEGKYE